MRTRPLKRLPAAFDHEEFVFELKHDGFRALAYVSPDECRLVSRNNHVYKSFRDLHESMRQLGCNAVLDGEIVSLDETGRPQFYDLLRHRGSASFYAFDILWLKGPPAPAVPGREARQDIEYERRGTANVFCAVEPQAGKHFTFATPDRSGRDLPGRVAAEAERNSPAGCRRAFAHPGDHSRCPRTA